MTVPSHPLHDLLVDQVLPARLRGDAEGELALQTLRGEGVGVCGGDACSDHGPSSSGSSRHWHHLRSKTPALLFLLLCFRGTLLPRISWTVVASPVPTRRAGAVGAEGGPAAVAGAVDAHADRFLYSVAFPDRGLPFRRVEVEGDVVS
jgi:hypothetical protein